MRLIDADEALRLFGKEYEKTKELIHNGETQLMCASVAGANSSKGL